MKSELILTRVHAILALSDDPTPVRRELQLLAEELSAEVRKEAAAARGAGSAAQAIQRMLNGLKKQDSRRPLHYAWIDAKGRQCACDGFRAFRLVEALPLEPRPEDAGTPLDLDKVWPEITPQTHDALPLPSVSDVKAHMALQRAENGRRAEVLWDFGPGRPVVNAAYLLDLMAVLPDAKEIFVARGPRGLVSPLFARSQRGDAILLPVRISNSSERAEQAEANEHARIAAEILESCAAKPGQPVDMPLERFAEFALHASAA